MASDILLWTPSHVKRSVGRPYRTFIDQLSDDIGLEASGGTGHFNPRLTPRPDDDAEEN